MKFLLIGTIASLGFVTGALAQIPNHAAPAPSSDVVGPVHTPDVRLLAPCGLGERSIVARADFRAVPDLARDGPAHGLRLVEYLCADNALPRVHSDLPPPASTR
jgi:hypothetical protein